MAERSVFYEKLLTAQSAAETTAVIGPARMARCREFTCYAVFGPGTTAGTVVVETAPDPAYTGTWSNVGTMAWAAASRAHHVAVTGAFQAIRARISVAVVGGTVDVHAIGN